MDKASRETVDLDGLAIKIFGKYLKFLQQKVLDRQQRQADPANPASKGGANKNNMQPTPAEQLADTMVFSEAPSVHMSEFPIESSA